MSLCILTNDSALFSFASPESMQNLRSMPLGMTFNAVTAPTQVDFERTYAQIEHDFSTLLVLCPSPTLLAGLEAAQAAAHAHGGSLKISVLNTGQIGPGLGMLAQLAARLAASSTSLDEVEDTIRGAIPHLFTLICPGKNPQEDHEAASDPTNQPIFSLENGALLPYKKVRTRRHLMEDMQEFLEEFDKPQQLSLFHGYANKLRTQPLREAANRLFPGVPITDLNLNPPIASIFGAQTMGLTVLELPQKNVR